MYNNEREYYFGQLNTIQIIHLYNPGMYIKHV